MCGIFGYLGSKRIPLKEATEIIEHRGPDSFGYLRHNLETGQLDVGKDCYEHEDGQKKVLLGFRRLAILDLNEHASQPFSDQSGRYHITFNGEIYNYLELREELTTLGYSFKTNSDTEVLLNAYIEWGSDCLPKFNGMWAFAILDKERKTLFCARDRFGIKPFYYAFNSASNELFWASEIKQLIRAGVPKKLNEGVIRDFLEKSVLDHTEYTFYDGILSLKAGHFFEVDLEQISAPRPERFWQLEAKPKYEGITYEEATREFLRLFKQSITLRFRSDVTVGACLSGGLDSSSIVATASTFLESRLQTFTSAFEDKRFDESEYVLDLKKKYDILQNHFCSLNEQVVEEDLDQVLYHQDEPFGALGVLAQWEVMKLAKKHKVPVLLDGQGGDELLGGYRKFYAFYLKELFQRRKFGTFAKEAGNLIFNRDFRFFDMEGINRYLGRTKAADFFTEKGRNLSSNASIGLGSTSGFKGKSKDDIEKFSYPILLRYEDRNSMAFSIESRVPFLDYRLVEFLYSIPPEFLIRDGFTKAIMRDSLVGILPDSIKNRKSKLGFATPQTEWMKGGLNNYFASHFEKMSNPYLNSKTISEDFSKYPKSSMHSNTFFRLFIFDKWFQSNFD